jgi:hypothetical protein
MRVIWPGVMVGTLRGLSVNGLAGPGVGDCWAASGRARKSAAAVMRKARRNIVGW